MLESIESSKFVQHRARMPGEFDSKKDSRLKNFEQRPSETNQNFSRRKDSVSSEIIFVLIIIILMQKSSTALLAVNFGKTKKENITWNEQCSFNYPW